jgi:UDP-N-acetyl-alpha-D-quinovosamine dehydrogenase
MRILVTGATGFVGTSLIPLLCQNGYLVRLAVRDADKNKLEDKSVLDDQINFDLDSNDNNYDQLLHDVDIVIHLAARVHILDGVNNEAIYKRTNSMGTERLAREAAERGVKRFIYLSSIKVNGEKNLIDVDGNPVPFNKDDVPCPNDAYALSKLEAEFAVRNICNNSDMDFVILRPVLIYGPGVRANFLSLLNIINKNYPLPLASVRNKRSLIYVKNLAHAILKCVNYTEAANKIYLISDVDISVPDLIRKIAQYFKKKAFLFSFPVGMLKVVGSLIGKKRVIDRLTESLLVDNSRFIKELQWKPPYSLDEGIQSTVDWYKQS